MNSERNTAVPAVQRAVSSKFGFFVICIVGGLVGGALAYPILVRSPEKVLAATDVMVRAVPDRARGVTCYVNNLGGMSCVPDQWFMPPEASVPAPAVKPQPQPQANIRGWDL